MSEIRTRSQNLARALEPALIGAAACLAILLLGIFVEPGHVFHVRPAQFFRSWLFAWLFWFGISLGSMGVVMMHHLFGGAWGYLIRRFGETAAACVPVMAVLFIPIILGVKYLYPWAVPDEVAHDAILRHKAHYLNWPFWTVRAVIYLVAFSGITWMLRSMSLASDRREPGPLLGRLYRLSTGGEILYFVLMSLAAVDWIMSREPHWYSTVFGFIVVVGQALTALCFLILMVTVYADEPPLKDVIRPNYLNDLGTVLIVFVILWAYLSFAQFLVTWLGNNQNEITWYIRRTQGVWRWIGGALILFHFLIPFILLLMRPMKRKLGRLAAVAGGVLVMRAIDVLYWVTPSDTHEGNWGVGNSLYAEAMNLLALLAIGGLWFATFLWLLKDTPILPIGDPIPVVPENYGHGHRSTSTAVE
jgi:hypothetical protein